MPIYKELGGYYTNKRSKKHFAVTIFSNAIPPPIFRTELLQLL